MNEIYYSDFDITLGKNPITHDVIKKTNSESIRQSLRILLNTQFYDRCWQPNLGTNLKDLLFNQLDDYSIRIAKHELVRCFEANEPRIQVDEISITQQHISNIVIKITYTILSMNAADTFVYSINKLR